MVLSKNSGMGTVCEQSKPLRRPYPKLTFECGLGKTNSRSLTWGETCLNVSSALHLKLDCQGQVLAFIRLKLRHDIETNPGPEERLEVVFGKLKLRYKGNDLSEYPDDFEHTWKGLDARIPFIFRQNLYALVNSIWANFVIKDWNIPDYKWVWRLKKTMQDHAAIWLCPFCGWSQSVQQNDDSYVWNTGLCIYCSHPIIGWVEEEGGFIGRTWKLMDHSTFLNSLWEDYSERPVINSEVQVESYYDWLPREMHEELKTLVPLNCATEAQQFIRGVMWLVGHTYSKGDFLCTKTLADYPFDCEAINLLAHGDIESNPGPFWKVEKTCDDHRLRKHANGVFMCSCAILCEKGLDLLNNECWAWTCCEGRVFINECWLIILNIDALKKEVRSKIKCYSCQKFLFKEIVWVKQQWNKTNGWVDDLTEDGDVEPNPGPQWESLAHSEQIFLLESGQRLGTLTPRLLKHFLAHSDLSWDFENRHFIVCEGDILDLCNVARMRPSDANYVCKKKYGMNFNILLRMICETPPPVDILLSGDVEPNPGPGWNDLMGLKWTQVYTHFSTSYPKDQADFYTKKFFQYRSEKRNLCAHSPNCDLNCNGQHSKTWYYDATVREAQRDDVSKNESEAKAESEHSEFVPPKYKAPSEHSEGRRHYGPQDSKTDKILRTILNNYSCLYTGDDYLAFKALYLAGFLWCPYAERFCFTGCHKGHNLVALFKFTAAAWAKRKLCHQDLLAAISLAREGPGEQKPNEPRSKAKEPSPNQRSSSSESHRHPRSRSHPQSHRQRSQASNEEEPLPKKWTFFEKYWDSFHLSDDVGGGVGLSEQLLEFWGKKLNHGPNLLVVGWAEYAYFTAHKIPTVRPSSFDKQDSAFREGLTNREEEVHFVLGPAPYANKLGFLFNEMWLPEHYEALEEDGFYPKWVHQEFCLYKRSESNEEGNVWHYLEPRFSLRTIPKTPFLRWFWEKEELADIVVPVDLLAINLFVDMVQVSDGSYTTAARKCRSQDFTYVNYWPFIIDGTVLFQGHAMAKLNERQMATAHCTYESVSYLRSWIANSRIIEGFLSVLNHEDARGSFSHSFVPDPIVQPDPKFDQPSPPDISARRANYKQTAAYQYWEKFRDKWDEYWTPEEERENNIFDIDPDLCNWEANRKEEDQCFAEWDAAKPSPDAGCEFPEEEIAVVKPEDLLDDCLNDVLGPIPDMRPLTATSPLIVSDDAVEEALPPIPKFYRRSVPAANETQILAHNVLSAAFGVLECLADYFTRIKGTIQNRFCQWLCDLQNVYDSLFTSVANLPRRRLSIRMALEEFGQRVRLAFGVLLAQLRESVLIHFHARLTDLCLEYAPRLEVEGIVSEVSKEVSSLRSSSIGWFLSGYSLVFGATNHIEAAQAQLYEERKHIRGLKGVQDEWTNSSARNFYHPGCQYNQNVRSMHNASFLVRSSPIISQMDTTVNLDGQIYSIYEEPPYDHKRLKVCRMSEPEKYSFVRPECIYWVYCVDLYVPSPHANVWTMLYRCGKTPPAYNSTKIQAFRKFSKKMLRSLASSLTVPWRAAEWEGLTPEILIETMENMPGSQAKLRLEDFLAKFEGCCKVDSHHSRCFVKTDENPGGGKPRHIFNSSHYAFQCLQPSLFDFKRAFKQEKLVEYQGFEFLMPQPHVYHIGLASGKKLTIYATYMADTDQLQDAYWMHQAMAAQEDEIHIAVGGDDNTSVLCVNGCLYQIEGDVSMCDQSMHEGLSTLFIWFFKILGAPPSFLKVLEESYRMPCLFFHKEDYFTSPELYLIVYFHVWMLATGWPQTSASNTVILILLVSFVLSTLWYALKKENHNTAWIQEFLSCQFAELGIKMKLHVYEGDYCQATFHKKYFLRQADGTFTASFLPGAMIPRMLRVRTATPLTREGFIQRIREGMASRLPVVAHPCLRRLMLRVGKDVKWSAGELLYKGVSAVDVGSAYQWNAAGHEAFWVQRYRLNYSDLPVLFDFFESLEIDDFYDTTAYPELNALLVSMWQIDNS